MIVLEAIAVGFLQVGGDAQVTLLAQPAALVVALEVKINVKHPEAEEAVYAGGKVVPDKVANNGAEALFPS